MSTASVLVTPVTVVEVAVPSPSFVRIVLGGSGLAEFGVDGPFLDQRIKLLFPPASGQLPDLAPHGEHWYAAWSALPAAEQGAMRTYSVLDVIGVGAQTRVVVDIVRHPGAHGPGSAWATQAAPGDEVLLIGPRRGAQTGGIEFAPDDGARLCIGGDETALPAIARILADLPATARGQAHVEVPLPDDVRDLPSPQGVSVHWHPRGPGEAVGSRLVPALLDALGATLPGGGAGARPTAGRDEAARAEAVVWETAAYSASGHDQPDDPGRPSERDDYLWVAAECEVVRQIRKVAVAGLGLERRQCAFMGYWRQTIPAPPPRRSVPAEPPGRDGGSDHRDE
jgi:NADPH-dependent ferric siderophore reductase